MLSLDAEQVKRALPWAALVEALREMFRAGCHVPPRHHHEIGDGVGPGTLLLMPAWQAGVGLGVKLVTVFPENARQSLPSVAGLYVLFDPATGFPMAILEGGELTARRTAAASALAASYLARKDAAVLTMVGTGRLSANLIEAHRSVRPIERVLVWGRDAAKARAVVEALPDIKASVASDLEDAVRQSDIVSCATLSAEPLVRGAWLRPGTHLDLVGAFKPTMRESDAEVWRRADLLAADTLEGARREAGDILLAEADGVPVFARLHGTLAELTRGEAPGRTGDGQISVFKSVGTALEDLAAARLAVGRHT
jgi:ornithine cyclodeaminase